MYKVKTRNWHCKKWVLRLLQFTCKFTVKCNVYDDGDGKFWLETSNGFKAWMIWVYFMLLRHFSGGWTYIVRPNHNLGVGYKSIY